MFEKADPSGPVIFFGKPPSLDELCALTVKVITQANGAVLASTFQPQIIRCRELIFTEPEILASPAFGIQNAFHIILKKSLYKTGKLQARFQKIGLEASKPVPVTPKLLQSCLNYTIYARIAPNWNKAGQWLIHGRDFLTHKGYVDAVKMDLTVNNSELYLNLEASTVRFPVLQVADLDIAESAYREFLQNSDAEIQSYSILDSWCNVLPSMKKGIIVSISRSLPADSPFKSYKEIKRHWKNTYGYRLPESDENMIYYQIHFRPLGDRLFTYPEICLRARDIQKLPRVDPKPILTAFLQDFHCKMSKVCGYPLMLQNKASYPVISLSCSTKAETSKVNLTSKVAAGRKLLYRKREDIPTTVANTPVNTVQTTLQANFMDNSVSTPQWQEKQKQREQQQSQSCVKTNTDMNRTQHFPSEHIGTVQDGQRTITSTEGMNCSNKSQYQSGSYLSGNRGIFDEIEGEKNPDTVEKEKTNKENPVCTKEASHGSRVVPSFTPRIISSRTVTKDCVTTETKRLVPCFKPKSLKSSVIPNQQQYRVTPILQGRDIIRPSFPVKKPESNISVRTLSSKVAGMRAVAYKLTDSVNNTKLQSNHSYLPVVLDDLKTKSCSIITGAGDHTNTIGNKSSCSQRLDKINNNPLAVRIENHPKEKSFLNCTPTTPSWIDLNSENNSEEEFDTQDSSAIGHMSYNSFKSLKRVAQMGDDCTSKPKKSRSKTQVQDIDVEALARKGQLHKANAVTLTTWLKDRGIPCKSKEKKGILLDKVKIVLDLCTAEV